MGKNTIWIYLWHILFIILYFTLSELGWFFGGWLEAFFIVTVMSVFTYFLQEKIVLKSEHVLPKETCRHIHRIFCG